MGHHLPAVSPAVDQFLCQQNYKPSNEIRRLPLEGTPQRTPYEIMKSTYLARLRLLQPPVPWQSGCRFVMMFIPPFVMGMMWSGTSLRPNAFNSVSVFQQETHRCPYWRFSVAHCVAVNEPPTPRLRAFLLKNTSSVGVRLEPFPIASVFCLHLFRILHQPLTGTLGTIDLSLLWG